MFEIGVAKKVIDICPLGVGMMGYGIAKQKVEGTLHPLHVRSFMIRSLRTQQVVAYASVELAFLSLAVRQGVLAKLEQDHAELGLNEHNVMLTATHTHSAPGGYSHYLLYNLSIPGFRPEIYEAVVATIVDALVTGFRSMQPGYVGIAQGAIPVSEDVAFNRSLEAYNQNLDVTPLLPGEEAQAVNRTMTVLRFDDASGVPVGMFSWFGVHCTSLHSDNKMIDPDNKGAAARQFEKRAQRAFQQPDFVAGFCQTSAGDVSPSFRWDESRGLNAGPYENDYQNSEFNGEIQQRFAWQLFEEAAESPLDSDTLLAATHYADHGAVEVDPAFAQGLSGVTTSPGDLGLSMLMGTADGRGPLFHARSGVRRVNRLTGQSKKLYQRLPSLVAKGSFDSQLRSQGAKFRFLDLSNGAKGRAFYVFRQDKPLIPGWVDPSVARVKELGKAEGIGGMPWAPQILPIQLFVIGSFALPALPGEPTTVSGYRVESTVREALAALDIKTVAVVGYANAYSGYITTYEEYQAQCYEGGSTIFGPWTLAGYLTRFVRLAASLRAVDNVEQLDVGAEPLMASHEELAPRRLS